jgi:sensor histidine kinase regulating citrate/malate metabolism
VVGQKKRGSGFGLLLSKIYVNACDGDLTLDHTGKNGTTFAISLPIASRMKTKTAIAVR